MPISTFSRICALAAGLVLLAGACDTPADKPPPAPAYVHASTDWPAFLARHDLRWTRMSERWRDGAFIGNGLTGAMIYRDATAPTAPLRFELGRTDVTAHERLAGVDWSVPRIPIGDLLLQPAGAVTSVVMRLDLWNAEVTGSVITDRGRLDWRAFTHYDDGVLLLEVNATGGERAARITLRPAWGVSPRMAWEHKEVPPGDLPPRPVLTYADGVTVAVQELRAGGQVATALKIEAAGAGRRRAFVYTDTTFPQAWAASEAREFVSVAAAAPFGAWVARHRDWWHAYYPQALLSFSNAKWESFYWIQMYKLAAATRPGAPVIDNQGPWLTQTGWPGTWWNLNVQLAYSPAYTANRIDQGAVLCEQLGRYRENLARNAPEKYKDVYHLERYTSFDMRADPKLPFVHELGNLTWALHDCWRLYRATLDEALLRDTLYPLLKGSLNLYLQMAETGADGKLHLPPTHSPEYDDPAVFADANYALALFRWGLETLLWSERHLGLRDPQHGAWRAALAALAPPPQGADGLWIGAGQPLAHGHRHYSHLLAIFPLHLLATEDPAEAALVNASVDHWLDLAHASGLLTGYTLTGGAAMRASAGRGDDALGLLDEAMPFFEPTTMYLEGAPVLETPLAAAESLHYLFLQSWGGTLRVFPAVPAAWPDAVFHDLRAEGGFLVSARREGGTSRWLRVRSTAGMPCVVRTDLAEPVQLLAPEGVRLRKLSAGVYALGLRKNQEAVLFAAGEAVTEPSVGPVGVTGPINPFGLH
jgi:hypothetical protein